MNFDFFMICTKKQFSNVNSSAFVPGKVFMDMDGHFMDLVMLINSFNRGTPRVTFFALIPALWNVLRVICVIGCPND